MNTFICILQCIVRSRCSAYRCCCNFINFLIDCTWVPSIRSQTHTTNTQTHAYGPYWIRAQLCEQDIWNVNVFVQCIPYRLSSCVFNVFFLFRAVLDTCTHFAWLAWRSCETVSCRSFSFRPYVYVIGCFHHRFDVTDVCVRCVCVCVRRVYDIVLPCV